MLVDSSSQNVQQQALEEVQEDLIPRTQDHTKVRTEKPPRS